MLHRRGPAAAKHRSPKLLYVRRTTHFASSSSSVVSWMQVVDLCVQSIVQNSFQSQN